MLTVVTGGRVRSYLLDSLLHGVRNPHSIPTRIQGVLGKGTVGEEGYQCQTCNDSSAVYTAALFVLHEQSSSCYTNREKGDTCTDM